MKSQSTLAHLRSEVLKKGYSLEQIESIYALGQLYLETGNLRQASVIFDGLIHLVPNLAPASIGQAIIALFERDFMQGAAAARRASESDSQVAEATLLLVIAMFGLGDYNSAGTYLGEIREAMESGIEFDKNVVRVYRMLLARYRSRA
jgi:hypothetical protein